MKTLGPSKGELITQADRLITAMVSAIPSALILFLAGCAAPAPALRPGAAPAPAPAPQLPAPAPARLERIDATIPWQLPANAGAYCWQLQISFDLVNWSDCPGACLSGEQTVTATNPAAFFRLKGTP